MATQLTKDLNDLNIKNDKKVQDIFNNNHIESLNNELFDAKIFLKIKESNFLNKYDKFVLVHNVTQNEYYFDLGDNLILRPLKRDDYSKNYLNLLSQLTVVGNVTKEQFEQRYDSMKYFITNYKFTKYYFYKSKTKI